MKPLKPSMKEKKRYLLIKGEKDIKKTKEIVYKAVLDFIGVLGAAKAGINWVKIQGLEKNLGVLSINRESLNQVRASLCVCPEKIEILRVSGTIKGLKLT